MEPSFGKSDVVSSLALGVLTAIFLVIISTNLSADVPLLGSILAHRWLFIGTYPLVVILFVYIAFRLGSLRHSLYQLGKFATIGASNTSIDLGVLNLLILMTRVEIGVLYSVFKALSFILATTNSYFWNKLWTFNNPQKEGMGKQFLSFLLVSGIGFGVNVLLATLIVNFVEPLRGISQGLWANVAALVALIFTMLWNFLGYKFVVFRK